MCSMVLCKVLCGAMCVYMQSEISAQVDLWNGVYIRSRTALDARLTKTRHWLSVSLKGNLLYV